MKDKSKLVSAFHVISEKKLINPTLELDYDIFVWGDSKDSVGVVNELINERSKINLLRTNRIILSCRNVNTIVT